MCWLVHHFTILHPHHSSCWVLTLLWAGVPGGKKALGGSGYQQGLRPEKADNIPKVSWLGVLGFALGGFGPKAHVENFGLGGSWSLRPWRVLGPGALAWFLGPRPFSRKKPRNVKMLKPKFLCIVRTTFTPLVPNGV